MGSKFIGFFKNFFRNITADPVSSFKGVVQLAAAAGVSYGMSTGAVPVDVGAPIAASFATSGVHALGTNANTGEISQAATKIEAVVDQAAVVAPAMMSIVDQVAAAKAEAEVGQQKIDTFQAITTALGQIIPPNKGE